MFQTDLVECVNAPGYYLVRGKEFVAINKVGSVVYADSGELLEQKTRSKYFAVNLGVGYDDVHVHRMMAETFLVKPEVSKSQKLHVNHIDGVKRNNDLTNLEWTTPKGNSIHAYKTGLRKDNVPVLVKDLRTNEVMRFYSIWECARHFNTNGMNIHYYLKPEGMGKIRRRYFLFIREGQQWPKVDKKLMNKRVEVVLLDRKGKQGNIFSTLEDAASYACEKTSTLGARLRRAISKGLLSCTSGMYEVMYLVDVDKSTMIQWIKMDPKVQLKKKRGTRKPKRIEVHDLDTGQKYQLDSVVILAKRFGVSKNTFQKHIYQNQGVWRKKLHVRYL